MHSLFRTASYCTTCAVVLTIGFTLPARAQEEAASAALRGDAAYALASTYAFAPLPAYADSAFKYLRIALAEEDTVKPLYDPDLYYLTMELNEKTGRYEPRPMVAPVRVDERRAEKGMEPIDEQLRRFNESMQRDFGTPDEKVQE